MNTTDRIKLQSGNILTKHGFKIQAEVFDNIRRDTISSEEMIRFFKGYFPQIRTSMKDTNFKITELEPWQNFIDKCWLKEKQWTADDFDCDDFSDTFGVFAKLALKVSVSKIYGRLLNKDTEKPFEGTGMGYHYWYSFVIISPNGKRLYFYEPINGLMVQYLGQQKIIMGSGMYVPEQVICN